VKKTGTRAAAALLLAAALTTALLPPVSADEHKVIPAKAQMVTGVTVYGNQKAKIDASNAAEGYVMVAYLGGKNVRIKARVTKTGGTTYTYDLNNAGRTETFPFTEGDGEYTVEVFENVSSTSYALANSCKVQVKLRDRFLPFLYPNQYVNFNDQSEAVKKADELCRSLSDDLSRVRAVYTYVIGALRYDTEKAKTVQSGYLPDVDAVMKAGKGICFDYASLMGAMLRSRGIPCKLVVGYVGEAYHAWLNVYIEDKGWIDKLIYFDGQNWRLMDPTFASSLGENSDSLKKYIGDGKSYQQKYAY